MPAGGGIAPEHTTRDFFLMESEKAGKNKSPPGHNGNPSGAGKARTPPAGCGFPGCGLQHHAKGYCKKHYAMQRRMSTAAFRKMLAEAAEGGGPDSWAKGKGAVRSRNKAERLELIKKRYETRQQEIEAIRQSLETED